MTLLPGRMLALATLLLAGLPAWGYSDTEAEKEAAVRAAFIYRLTFFAHWDAGAFTDDNPRLRVCIAADGRSRVYELLRNEADRRRATERDIAVERRPTADPMNNCHLIYREGVSADADVAVQPMQLLVVDSLAALDAGGMLALVRDHGADGDVRLAFVSRRDRIPANGVSISAKLLQLVRFADEGEAP